MRILGILVSFAAAASVSWFALPMPVVLKVLLLVVLAGLFLFINILPRVGGFPISNPKLKIAMGGYELLLFAQWTFVLGVLFCAYLIWGAQAGVWKVVANAAVTELVIYILLVNGLIRVQFSGQMPAGLRLAALILWWVPAANLFVARSAAGAVRGEYRHETERIKRNEARKGQNICATKYPVLMVHGIFFRDWERFNYWGRIPAELEANGCRLYYGNHQSSASVEQSAGEIAERIEKVLDETGAEKVNIIAHSKGGLDSRYAISVLGMAEKVASLTTINTPHRGSALAGNLIRVSPEKLVIGIGKNYDKLFKKLGDDQPDFLSGISGLTPEKCDEYNEMLPDSPEVRYQSAGSMMKSVGSAPFPLSLGYRVIKPTAGDNDGLVQLPSMQWGEYIGTQTGSKKPGVSHGDMIDLFRGNIPGFDVCEFYVGIVSDLKKKGL